VPLYVLVASLFSVLNDPQVALVDEGELVAEMAEQPVAAVRPARTRATSSATAGGRADAVSVRL